MKFKFNSGVTLVELLVVLGILGLLTAITLSTFISIRKNQALNKDTETIVEVLRQARSETVGSINASQYGVHVGTTKVTIFTGTVYSSGNSTNRDFTLSSTDTILSVTLTGGGSDVIFERLTGATSQNGTIVVSSPTTSQTKTVTIYKTGLVESQ